MPTPDPKTDGLPKLTKNQINFCHLYIGNKCSGAEALRQAFPKSKQWKPMSVYKRVNEILKMPKVMKYIEELRAEVRKDARISLGEHIDKLQEIRDLAIETHMYSAAVSAEMNRGKVSGLYVDRVEVAKHKPTLIVKRANGKRTGS